MLAWSIGTGLIVCWLLTAFAIVTGAVMIRMEDDELEKRFGDEYRKYRSRVPAVLPRPTTIPNSHEKLSSDGVSIRCEFGEKTMWQMAIDDLVCLAGYTTSAGPFADDYVLVFAGKDGLWREASFYSFGQDEVIKLLETKLGCSLALGLASSTTLASRIIWPKELEGHPLFTGKTVNPEVKRLLSSRQL